MYCTSKPRHRPCHLVLQAAQSTSHHYSTSWLTQRVRSRVRKKLKREKSNKSFISRPSATIIIIQPEFNLYKTTTATTTHFNYFKTIFLHKFNIMAQNNTRWTAPSFSFDTADQPAAWREFYTRVIDYLETIDIRPRRGRSTQEGMEADKNDVYRGGQTSFADTNRQQYHYTNRSMNTNIST